MLQNQGVTETANAVQNLFTPISNVWYLVFKEWLNSNMYQVLFSKTKQNSRKCRKTQSNKWSKNNMPKIGLKWSKASKRPQKLVFNKNTAPRGF